MSHIRVEGCNVEICIGRDDCLSIGAHGFERPWQHGILLELPTGSIRFATASELERNEWLEALLVFFRLRQWQGLPKADAISDVVERALLTTPAVGDESSVLRPMTIQDSTRMSTTGATGWAKKESLGVPGFSSAQRTARATPVRVDDDIIKTKKIPKRFSTAPPSIFPISRWSEEGLHVRKNKWTDAVNTLRAQGDVNFTASEALHQGFPYARGSRLVDALSKNARQDDFDLDVRQAACQAIGQELREIVSQVDEMQRNIESASERNQDPDDGSFLPGLWDATARHQQPFAGAHGAETDSRHGELHRTEHHGAVEGLLDRKLEDAVCRDIVSNFPKRWIETASSEVGGRLKWVSMSWAQQLAALYTALHDSNDIGQILKDLPGSDPTKATVTVTYQNIPSLVAELVVLATRMGDKARALACLESIFDDDIREQTSSKLYELATKLWMDELRDELIRRGHVKKMVAIKRTGTPTCPSRQQIINKSAAIALTNHAERMRQLALAAERDMVEEVPAVVIDMAVQEEEKDYSDEEPDVLGLKAESQGDGGDNGEEMEAAAEAPNKEGGDNGDGDNITGAADEEGQDRPPYWLADQESLKHIDQVKALLTSHSTDEIVKIIQTQHGHTLSAHFVEDLSDFMEMQSILADIPRDHPVITNLMRLADKLAKLYFEAWQAFAKQCKKHRVGVRDQYVMACAHHRVLPGALQTLTRFIDSRSADTLDLSGHCLTKHAICSFMEAITASGEYQDESALDLNFIRHRLDYEPITVLNLFQNDIRDGGCETLVHHLLLPSITWQLRTLRLGANNLRDDGCVALLPLLSSDRVSLQHLSIRTNGIGDKAIAQLARELNDNRIMLSLDIADNRGEQAAGTAIGTMLSENVTLTYLDCSSNMMRGRGAQYLAEGLGQNEGLIEIDLSWNGFGDQAPCGALAATLEKCQCLKKLNVAHNRINFRGATALAGHLENNGLMHLIILDGNPIGMPGVRLLMKAVKKASENQDFPTELSLLHCDKASGQKNSYDPAEPAGDYELDMSDGFSGGILKKLLRLHAMGRGFFVSLDNPRSISMDLLKLQARPSPNAMLNDQPYTIALPTYEGKDDDGNVCRVVNPDESDWKIPSIGILRFKFASVRVRDEDNDALDETALVHLKEAFQDRKLHHKERMEVIDLYISNDTVIQFEKVVTLLEQLRWNMGDAELCQTRGALVATCYHKISDSVRAPDSLDLLDAEARSVAEKILGVSSFSFTRKNPTGHYKLRLDESTEREICLRLIECRGEQSKRLSQLESYYKNRTGKRDPIERVWRNCKFNKRQMDFDMSWKVPEKGVLEFDFVSLRKPGADEEPLSDEDFFAYCQKELASFLKYEEEARFVAAVRRWSETTVFTCKQLRRLLRPLKTPLARVEIVVIGFSRTVDWHSYKFIQHELSVNEFKELRHRIGLVNLWDESCACDYYELDLADPEQRWICQEILHLGVIEPGENMGECMYDGVDFTITAAWLTDTPRRGLLQVYYNREAKIIRKIREKGAWDHDRSPFYKDGSVTNNNTVVFPATSYQWSGAPIFMPLWLKKFCKDSDGMLHEPPDNGWIREHKLRRIVAKLKEKFPTAKAAMKKLDRDGGGDLDRCLFGVSCVVC